MPGTSITGVLAQIPISMEPMPELIMVATTVTFQGYSGISQIHKDITDGEKRSEPC
jgi:hypothetical protein